jgi:hypothetical protein
MREGGTPRRDEGTWHKSLILSFPVVIRSGTIVVLSLVGLDQAYSVEPPEGE